MIASSSRREAILHFLLSSSFSLPRSISTTHTEIIRIFSTSNRCGSCRVRYVWLRMRAIDCRPRGSARSNKAETARVSHFPNFTFSGLLSIQCISSPDIISTALSHRYSYFAVLAVLVSLLVVVDAMHFGNGEA
jgi:hypothetical protein